ncbi:MAG: DUF4388 domain-containing protein [Deltaproteobacteria bacterium]|nr:DUF4388 domain-containing protein [Deltaproteobacteria bacterium]
MNLISALNKLADVKEVTIGTEDGRTVFHEGKSSADDVNAAAIVCRQNMAKTGEALGLGNLSDFVLQGKDSIIIVPREDKIATVKIAGKTDGKKVTELLQTEKWVFFDRSTLAERAPNASSTLGNTGTKKKPLPPMKGLSGAASKTANPFGVPSLKTETQRNQTPLPVPRGNPFAVSGRPASGTLQEAVAQGVSKNMPAPPQATGAGAKKTRTTSIPATPANRTLATIRLALFTGDLSEVNMQRSKVAEYNCFVDKQKEQLFVSQLQMLCDVVGQLLENNLSVHKRLTSLLENPDDLDASLQWAALVWQCRLYLAQGKLDAAEDIAISFYQISHEFDNATRAATHCLIANVYMMEEKLEGALKILKTGRKFAERSRTEILAASIALMEAQIFAAMRNYPRSDSAAEEAAQKLPHSAYPKIIQARLAILSNKIPEAMKLYDEILTVNSKQPDSLVDISIVSMIESKSIDLSAVEMYFYMRELAPSIERFTQMKEMLSKKPGFIPLRNLLVWRLLGAGDVNTARFLYQLDKTGTVVNRFKPCILIGYSDSAMVVTRYVDADKYMASLPSAEPSADVGAGARITSESSAPCLSLPSENILKMLEADVAEKLFSGELKAFSMPDLLEFLRNGKRTGALLCSSDQGVGAIELREGFITCAIVPDVDNIGTLLLEKGKITKERLKEAIKAQEKDISGARIGRILADEGIVDSESVKQALIEQTFSAIRTMLNWTNGRFVFTPSSPEAARASKGLDLKLDARFILMELFREMDESNK